MPQRPLERILQSQGFGTKKQCRSLVRRGKVQVGGVVAEDPFALFEPEGLQVQVAGLSWRCQARVVLAMHKPVAFECSRKPAHHRSVMELLDPHLVARGTQPVGRLDQDTSGLLIFTDDGALNHALASPKRHVAKTYRAQTAPPADAELVSRLLQGVVLKGEDRVSKALACRVLDDGELEMQIDEGKYHQVKRMIAAAGARCEALHRTRVGGLDLERLGLAAEQWRLLEPGEVDSLLAPMTEEA